MVSPQEIIELWRRGYLRSDGIYPKTHNGKLTLPEYARTQIGKYRPTLDRDYNNNLLFHPYRLWVVYNLIEIFSSNHSSITYLYPKSTKTAIDFHLSFLGKLRNRSAFKRSLHKLNEAVDLAIILEPKHLCKICYVGNDVNSVKQCLTDFQQAEYAQFTDRYLSSLSAGHLHEIHMSLRLEAARIDDNDELYLLIRSMPIDKRNSILGRIGLSERIRRIAELVRHEAYERYNLEFASEDVAFGSWVPGAREWLYGNADPTKNIRETQRRLVRKYFPQSQIRARLYVEGDTELGFFESLFTKQEFDHIEIINLRGDVRIQRKAQSTGSQNLIDRLDEQIKLDRNSRRFSIVCVDKDRIDVTRKVNQMIRNNDITGYVHFSEPDFEYGNFSIDEITSMVFRSLEQQSVPYDASGIRRVVQTSKSGRELNSRLSSCLQINSLKGRVAGRFLFESMFESGRFSKDIGKDRLMKLLLVLANVRQASFEDHRDRFRIDSESLELFPISKRPF